MTDVSDTAIATTGKVVFAHVPGREPVPADCGEQRMRILRECGLEKESAMGSPFPVVTLMAREALDAVKDGIGIAVWPGFCGEDVCTEDVDYESLRVGSLLRVGEALLLIARKGKNCGGKCGVSKVTLDCPLSQSWMSAWILRGGNIRADDPVSVLSMEWLVSRTTMESPA